MRGVEAILKEILNHPGWDGLDGNLIILTCNFVLNLNFI